MVMFARNKGESDLQHKEKNRRDEALRAVKSIFCVTIRQLSKLTDISKGATYKV
jgi:hypothetical protein